jgi:hypothetical protein
MNKELEIIWKKAVIPCSKYYPEISLEGLKKITMKSEKCRCSVRDSNQAPPEHKHGALPVLQPTHYEASRYTACTRVPIIFERKLSKFM